MKSQILQVLKNRYFLVTAFFLVWVGFFDQNDWVSRKNIDAEIKQLEEDKVFFDSEVERLQEAKKTLITNEGALEKYAREKYYMKRKGEDVFVIVD